MPNNRKHTPGNSFPQHRKTPHRMAVNKRKPTPLGADNTEPTYGALIHEMRQVVALLEKLIAWTERFQPPRRQTLDELDPPRGREFVSGGFHRRSGDI